jgi:hypothetical protein
LASNWRGAHIYGVSSRIRCSKGSQEGVPYLTADEWKIINLLRKNPEFTGLVLKLLGGRKSVKEALDEFLKIRDFTSTNP